ncbi:MAG: histidine kinase, partial [Cyanobacteria bacterium P01_F01_bin.86]
MKFSRLQQWLTVGFGVVLMTLLGAAMLARQSIVDRVHPLEVAEDERNEYVYLNELLVAIAEVDVNQKIYLDTGDEDARERFYEQVDILTNYFEELFEESEAMEEDSPYREDLINLNRAVERHFLLLESAIEHYETGTLTPTTHLDIAFQISEARLNAQTALQALVEGDIVEREWDIADTSVSINNDLWLSSVTV